LEGVRGIREVERQESEGSGGDDQEEGKGLGAERQISECVTGEFEIN
jgi:hypothetical protein